MSPRHGVTPAELRALCEHVAVYAGFPRALNALEVIDRVLTQAGVPGPPALNEFLPAASPDTVET